MAVFTGKDTEKIGPVPCGASLPGLRVPHHHVLATQRVYFVGHPVAVVVARDRYLAQDATDLIEVDYDVCPPWLNRKRRSQKALRQSIPSGPTTSRSPFIRMAATWTKRSPKQKWSSSSE